MTTAESWRMRGDVMEVCSCNVTCPCNFGGDPTQVPCEAAFGFRIQDGNYGSTRLDALNVALIITIPGKLFDGGWTLGAYFDQRANEQQMQALGTIFSGQAGGWPAALGGLIATALPPKQVPISFETVNGEHRISVPGAICQSDGDNEHVPQYRAVHLPGI